ncbi:hypothetical protein BDY21DRAFT_405245 [Lineolata rhizophorae]|uniref:Fe2OG dioxygenase domain-containing protein n=1 Tax=Lineolata rhizophorae TaxID=578093 RepID=A0A6A6NLW1_9PEZI|nr:hypothetical protein BDY21DRAFT_405245 [Lineolata rhizophorae]
MASQAGTADIPLIDITSPTAPAEIVSAAATFGFVFVKNHGTGLPPEDIDKMFDLSRDLFQAPEDVKAECSINSSSSGKNRGWLGMHTETLDPGNQKACSTKIIMAFNVGEFVNGKAQQPLPTPVASREGDIGRFADRCHDLCNKILELFAIGLEIPSSEGGSSWFSSRHDRSKGPSGSILRLLYYPPLPPTLAPTTDDIRAGAHSDYGSITLLFRLPSQPGLEILTPQGTWASVPTTPCPHPTAAPAAAPAPGDLPVLVNIGDLLSYWTAGLLKSTVHRVVFPPADRPAERLSIAYFCHPLDEARLVPVPSRVVEAYVEAKAAKGGVEGEGGPEEVERWRRGVPVGEVTAKDHLDARLRATYGIE